MYSRKPYDDGPAFMNGKPYIKTIQVFTKHVFMENHTGDPPPSIHGKPRI